MRIVIIGTDTLYSSVLARPLMRRGAVVAVVLTTTIFPHRSAFASVLEIVRHYSVSFFIYKVAETVLFRILQGIGRAGPGLAQMAAERGVPVVRTNDVNGSPTLERVAALKPDLIVSISASERFGRRLRSLPPQGCINVHAAPLPRYRGLAPYFWMLLNGETEAGIAVHTIDGGLDTGRVLAARRVPIHADDTAQALFLRCCLAGAEALDTAVTEIGEGRARPVEQIGLGSYFSWPTRAAMRAYRQRGNRLWRLGPFLTAARSASR